jgi:serine protease
MTTMHARRSPGRKPRTTLRTWRMAWWLALVALIGCTPAPPPLPPIALSVDATVAPTRPAIPGFEDGEPRPLAAVENEDGTVAEFVANELWLTTDDPAELAAFLARWSGVLLLTFDAEAAGLPGLADHHLVRVDASGADLDALADDLRALDPHATGDHRVSSQAGLDLIAAAGSEAAAGAEVGLNWVGSGAQFVDRTSNEAPSGVGSAGAAYAPNAFVWSSHALAGGPEIGVGEAWRALELANKFSPKVKLAVLDMGFQPDSDFGAGWIAISNVPLTPPTGTENLLWCGGGNDCPWHGQNVVSAAMAVAHNGFGGAGPAGPVAQPVMVFTLYDFFTSITALGQARVLGARIANMSYSAPVPYYLGWSVLPFEVVTKALRETGMLLFAAAGNEGRDVDAEGCTLGVCWERTWITPCENAGVICVGGMQGGGTARHPNSNYGREQVDLFAPFTLWLGPDPDAPANAARAISGTSFSSPFAAGVAALVWAADPSLGAGSVEQILLTTAHVNADPQVRRHVNAFGAVRAALGNVPPSITIAPSGTTEAIFNLPSYFTATVDDVEDPFPCCTVAWSSNVDGALGTGWQLEHTFATLGTRVVTATATDGGGATRQASVTVQVVNVAPIVTLSSPTAGAQPFRTANVILRASATDRNEPNETLACSNLVWTSSVPGDAGFPVAGCERTVAFATNGPRTITVTATDGQGASDAASVAITVVDPPPNLPPSVQVTSPPNLPNPAPPIDQPLNLTGTATDPEGATNLTYQWTTKLGNNAPIVVGTGASIQWTPNQTYAFNQEGLWRVEVRLNVTDPQGNVGTDFVVLEWLLIF